MPSLTDNNQQRYNDLEQENQSLRQQIDALQQQLKARDSSSFPDDSPRTLSERFLQLAIDNIPHIVFWKDRDSVYQGCNESCARLAGLNSPEDIVGKTDHDLPWKPEETEFFLECDRRVMESGIPELGILEPQQQNDGSRHWLETNKVPLHDGEGNVVGMLGTCIDVTERQQAQLELKRSNDALAAGFAARTKKLQATELRLQSLAANLPGVIFQYCLAPDGTYSFPYVSEKTREVYEVEPDDFLRVFDLIHPDDADHLQSTIQESARTLQRFDCEYRIITPSGILKWVQSMSQPVLQDNGDIIWDGIIIDISDRKRAEQAVRNSETKYQQILDSITDMVLVKGEHSRLVWANKAFREYYGMSNRELGKLIDAPFSNPDHTQQYVRDDAHVFTTGETLEVEEPVTRHDGTVRQFNTIKSAIRDEEGQIILTVGASRDVSDRKAAEEKLRQKEEQYRQIFETIIDGLGIVDLEQGQLVEVNPAYHQMHGYSYSEFLSLPYTDIVHPNSHALLGQFITALQEGRVFTCQGQNLHRNGRVIDNEVKGIPFPYRGKAHALVLVRDISEKVRLERERERQDQALRSIVEGTAAHTGEEFFRACVKSLAEVLEVAYALIAEFDRSQPETIKANVVASWMQTDFGDRFQYDLHGMPCNDVLADGKICRYVDSVQDLFPDASYLTSLEVESYVGIPLVDSRGTAVGLIAVLHTEALAEASETQVSILEIFAARVGAEVERMRSEKALREKDRILQLTLQAGKMGCWNWNRTTNEVIWSDGVEEILGLEENSFGGTFEDYIDLIHPEDLDAAQQAIAQALSTEQEYRIEHRIVCPDGSIQWIRSRGETWRNDQGEAIGLLGSVLNDTPQKLSEIALVKSTEQIQQQARQEKLLNRIASQIRISLDLDRILETTVRSIQQFLDVDRCHFAWFTEDTEGIYWDVIAEERNPEFPDFVGKHPADNFKVLSESVRRQEIVRLDDIATLDDPDLQQTLVALGNRSMLVLPVHADSGALGTIACIHHQVVRPWQDDEVEFLEAIAAQVEIAINQADLLVQSQARTQELEALLVKLQRTQTQLIQSEKMSSLGQMVAGVAHEINNPVSFIHGNLAHARDYMEDLLGLCLLYEEHYPDPHPDIQDEIEEIDLEFLKGDLQQLFQSMNVGTSRIEEIVKSLRTFSRLDEAALKDVDLHEGIDSTLMILRTRLRAQDWRPEIQVIKDYGNLPRVECYAGQLNQVFMNLLGNAIDAVETCMGDAASSQTDRGEIYIKTVKEGDRISIRIGDNGGGMSEETRANIFNPFFTTKPVGKGTGLGLAIAHQIITEKHGGTITCSSKSGQGTTFTITLPVMDSAVVTSGTDH
ncbi:MAG: PAS domain S-box protein [Cyanobacteria bacterium P01_C01_bin.89]